MQFNCNLTTTPNTHTHTQNPNFMLKNTKILFNYPSWSFMSRLGILTCFNFRPPDARFQAWKQSLHTRFQILKCPPLARSVALRTWQRDYILNPPLSHALTLQLYFSLVVIHPAWLSSQYTYAGQSEQRHILLEDLVERHLFFLKFWRERKATSPVTQEGKNAAVSKWHQSD